jgi:hypothetical protein
MTIHTIAWGKGGPAFLTKWKQMENTRSIGIDHVVCTVTLIGIIVPYQRRIRCSPVPISATSHSSDGTLLVLGSVEGSILFYNLESKSVLNYR